MQVYKIDNNGYYIESIIIEDEELTECHIREVVPNGLYRARWTGTEWVEDMMQEEIDELRLLESLYPTQEEIQNAELEIKILTLLQEVL